MDSQNNSQIKDWLQSSRDGNEEAFHQLYQFLHGQLFRFLLARLNSREEAQDILQEIFIDLWQALSSFRYQSDPEFYAFVFKITRRKLAKYYSKRKNSSPLDENISDDNYENTPEDWRWLLSGLEKLDDKYKIVLQLRYWSDLSFQDIAAYLGETENNVKVRHHRVLAKLNKNLEQYE